MKKDGPDSTRSISSSLSIILIMALSLWVIWIVVKKANEALTSAKDSPALNFQKRVNDK